HLFFYTHLHPHISLSIHPSFLFSMFTSVNSLFTPSYPYSHPRSIFTITLHIFTPKLSIYTPIYTHVHTHVPLFTPLHPYLHPSTHIYTHIHPPTAWLSILTATACWMRLLTCWGRGG
ncbi:hypothetical protein B484DRAFT_340980, partial [Ochromonadaceae sp. CCMP2298]